MTKFKNFLKSKYAVALVAGAFCNLAFAPFHIFVAAIFSIAVFYFLLENLSTKKSIFYLGWFYGFGYFLAGVYWISISLLVDAGSFAWLIPFAVSLIPATLGLYFAALALSYKFFLKRFKLEKTAEKIIIFAILWVVFEIARAFLFTGFPWNLIGYVWMFNDHFTQLANIFGVWGLSFFAVVFALFPAFLFQFDGKKFSLIKSKTNNKFAAALFLIPLISAAYGHVSLQENIVNKNVKLLLVQGNIKQEMKWNPVEKFNNFTKHIDLTNQQNLSDIKGVIWSETAIPYAANQSDDLSLSLARAIPQDGVLISGALKIDLADDQIKDVWNSVFAFSKSGDRAVIEGSYNKHHLVPFGEYIPWQKYLPFISKITDGAVGFSEGEGPQTIKTKYFSFSPLLCYEVIFPDKIIDKKNRPDLLINVTNDAWFGNSSGPYQHFDMAKMRAVEYGISLARVANTGITAFVDPFGRVIKKIDLNEEGIIDVNLIESVRPTIYSKYGFCPLILLIAALVVILLILYQKNKNASR